MARWAGGRAGGEAAGHRGGQAERQEGGQAGGQLGGQVCMQAGSRVGRQAKRQVGGEAAGAQGRAWERARPSLTHSSCLATSQPIQQPLVFSPSDSCRSYKAPLCLIPTLVGRCKALPENIPLPSRSLSQPCLSLWPASNPASAQLLSPLQSPGTHWQGRHVLPAANTSLELSAIPLLPIPLHALQPRSHLLTDTLS